jgi:hypothetical protein
MSERRIFGSAETQHNRWEGTVALDEGDSDDDLYKLFKLDQAKWAILGISLFGSHDETVSASAYAVDTETLRDAREAVGSDWPARIALQHDGRVPVTEFDLDAGSDAVMRVLSKHKQWSIRYQLSLLSDAHVTLAIVSSTDDLIGLDRQDAAT